MSFNYNIKSFSGKCTSSTTLREAYNTIVHIELLLKTELINQGTTANGHNIGLLIGQLGSTSNPNLPDATVNTYNADLEHSISKMICHGLDGQPTTVPIRSYPHMRYIRHISDWGTGTSDSQLTDVLIKAKALEFQLSKLLGV
ncbi:hypothetical protein [Ferrimonas balearica]|uniref:hypothetical protein n=1 Tax=Ferrimonas balearica TaxID=44012 RepID=UPI001C99D7AA|nr:hypothetical protein [Ferrimonas balearica]MBY5921728.1 hypothetical protein [Ferrimonas balearica]MBY5994932.1 hypothetical protein [Ferrimonas balearica]